MTGVIFCAAAAAGALIRWQARRVMPGPVATLAVNTVGAFALGLLVNADPVVATIAGTAGLGALTTFSALAADARDLALRDPVRAAFYLIATISLGFAAALTGIAIAS